MKPTWTKTSTGGFETDAGFMIVRQSGRYQLYATRGGMLAGNALATGTLAECKVAAERQLGL